MTTEPRSERDRLARCAFRLRGVLVCVDQLEEFFQPHERELLDEVVQLVIVRIDTQRERTNGS